MRSHKVNIVQTGSLLRRSMQKHKRDHPVENEGDRIEEEDEGQAHDVRELLREKSLLEKVSAFRAQHGDDLLSST